LSVTQEQIEQKRQGLAPLLAVMALLLAATFWWTFQTMIVRWEQPNSYYSHGWLIPPVVAWLIYRKRKELAACPRRPEPLGLAVLIPSVVLHLLGAAWRVGFFSGFAFLGVLVGLIWSLFGLRFLKKLAFPLAFLIFMIPLPELLVETVSFRMKLMAAWAATSLVNTFGLTAVREGSYITISTGTLVVDDVCSGLKYLISLLAFGALYAHLSAVRGWKKWALFLTSVPVAYVANVGRVTLMVLVGQWRGIGEVNAWYFHDFFGFALFVVAFVCLFLIESFMMTRKEKSGGEAAAETPAAAETAPPPPLAPPSGRLKGGVLVTMGLTAALSLHLTWPRATAPASELLRAIPLQTAGWTGRDYALNDRVYELLGTRDVLSRTYRNEQDEAAYLVLVMAQQMKRRTHPPEQCFAGEGYEIQSAQDRIVTVTVNGASRDVPVRELLLSHPKGTRLSWYFYKTGGHVNTDYWRHQATVALSKLSDGDSADIMVRTETDVRDLDQARRTLADFFGKIVPPILSELP
jgi:exosortase A